nr:RecName: Full=Nucleoside diphosphate kinase 1; AltName: Full=Nucleoside diphosphate kinase I; Short=NDK I; Short=NDP kinase I; Short=NDPK I [Pseudotsuga menziesii]
GLVGEIISRGDFAIDIGR